MMQDKSKIVLHCANELVFIVLRFSALFESNTVTCSSGKRGTVEGGGGSVRARTVHCIKRAHIQLNVT